MSVVKTEKLAEKLGERQWQFLEQLATTPKPEINLIYFRSDNCFVEDTPVLLADGKTVSIQNVKEGDLLWSYDIDNGLKPVSTKVVQTFQHESDDVYELTYGASSLRTVKVTGDHLVYTENGWKKVADIRNGETLFRMRVEPWKGKTLEQRYGEQRAKEIKRALAEKFKDPKWQKYLARRHRQKFGGQWLPPETMAKNTARLRAYPHIPPPIRFRNEPSRLREIYVKVSRRMKKKNPMYNQESKEKMIKTFEQRHGDLRVFHSLKTKKQWETGNLKVPYGRRGGHPTKGEEKLRRYLDDLDVSYEPEYVIKAEGKRMVVDVAIPSMKKIIEYDGWDGHYTDEGKKRDEMRDKYLTSLGWEVLRVKRDEIWEEAHMTKLLTSFLYPRRNRSYWSPVKKVRKLNGTFKVFNLRCYPHEFYVVNGLLVHNCPHCRAIEESFYSYVQEHPEINLIKIDADQSAEATHMLEALLKGEPPQVPTVVVNDQFIVKGDLDFLPRLCIAINLAKQIGETKEAKTKWFFKR
jgi:glutaredoxin